MNSCFTVAERFVMGLFCESISLCRSFHGDKNSSIKINEPSFESLNSQFMIQIKFIARVRFPRFLIKSVSHLMLSTR